MKKILRLSSFALLAAMALTACNKEKLEDLIVTKDYDVANQMTLDAKDMIDANFSSTENARVAAACDGVVITIENADNFETPDTLTIDFGSEPIFCHGKWRSGKIIGVRTAPFLSEGSTTTITFENYYVNENGIEGGKTVSNDGLNTDGEMVFSINKELTVNRPNGNVITWSSERSRTWVSGSDTPLDKTDDQYEIDGSASGTHSNGGSFSATTTTPILLDLSCWSSGSCARVAGVLEITPPNGNVRTVDYGDGSCDCSRTITVNGNTTEIINE